MSEYLAENGIVAVRVDDRMIHGQVATRWIPDSKATRAMVVNERASTNDMVRTTNKMATPAGVSLSMLAPTKAAENFNNGNYVGQRVFVVGPNVADIYELFQLGVKLKRVNLGNVTQNTGETFVLNKTVRVNLAEKEMLREMRDAGIEITCQFQTTDAVIHCTSVLD